MKIIQIITVITTLTVVSCTATSQNNNLGFDLFPSIKGTYYSAECDSGYLFLVDVQLINKSNTPKDFEAYKCLTCNNFLTNTTQVSILENLCAGNYPILISVKPNQKLTIPLILKAKRNYTVDSIKIGLVLFPKESFKLESFGEELHEMKSSRKNVIWSNSISIGQLVGKQFEIVDVK